MMNAIEAFRKSQLNKQPGSQSEPTSPTAAKYSLSAPSLPTRKSNEDINRMSLPESINDKEEITNNGNHGNNNMLNSFNRRSSTPGDLRERSLAMYKSINNMLALVKRPDIFYFTKIPFDEARPFAIDLAYRELQQYGPLTKEEIKEIVNIVENTLDYKSDEWKTSTNNSPMESPRSPDSDIPDAPFEEGKITPYQGTTTTLNAEKIRDFIIEKMSPITKLKKEANLSEAREKNEDLKIEISSSCTKGRRKHMEDQHIVIPHLNDLLNIKDKTPQAYVGVFDGHSGNGAAEYSRIHVHANLMAAPTIDTEPSQAFHFSFHKTDSDFNDFHASESVSAGTTACSILFRENSIYIGNVGDTEAIISRTDGEPVVLTTKHTPDVQDEKDRIQRAGGAVVWYGTWRVNGLLSVSRSLGDINLRDVVTAEPAVHHYTRSETDEFMVIGTDGLWDVVKYQEAVDFVRDSIRSGVCDRKVVAKLLMEEALNRKSSDNTTVVIVFFDK